LERTCKRRKGTFWEGKICHSKKKSEKGHHFEGGGYIDQKNNGG